MTLSLPGRTMPDGSSDSLNTVPVDHQRVPGVVPALEARDHVRPLAQPVDDLALALVAPLRADDHHVAHAASPSRAAPGYIGCAPRPRNLFKCGQDRSAGPAIAAQAKRATSASISPTIGAQQLGILAFAHDPDQGLGAGLADHQPAAAAHARLAGGDRGAHARLVERRRALAEADVGQHLREGREDPGELAGAPAGLDHGGEELQRRDQPVAGGDVVGHHDVARLLAAEVVAALAHRLDHVAVADGGAQELQALRLQVPLEPEVRHHRRDQRALGEPALGRPAVGDQRHELVAVGHRAPSRR